MSPKLARRSFLGLLTAALSAACAWIASIHRIPAGNRGHEARFWRTLTTRD